MRLTLRLLGVCVFEMTSGCCEYDAEEEEPTFGFCSTTAADLTLAPADAESWSEDE